MSRKPKSCTLDHLLSTTVYSINKRDIQFGIKVELLHNKHLILAALQQIEDNRITCKAERIALPTNQKKKRPKKKRLPSVKPSKKTRAKTFSSAYSPISTICITSSSLRKKGL